MELFNEKNEWQKEWINMPEFKQQKDVPYQKITISFSNEDDVKNFEKLLNQKITKKTKSLWYPYKLKDNRKNRAYVDEK